MYLGEISIRQSFADVVRHFLWNNHGNLYHATHFTVSAPWGLVNHLFNTLLVDGIAVDGVGSDHVTDFLLRLGAMAGHEVLAQHGAAFLVKGGPRALVHENHFTFQVTHGDGTMGALGPSQGVVDDILLVHCLEIIEWGLRDLKDFKDFKDFRVFKVLRALRVP